MRNEKLFWWLVLVEYGVGAVLVPLIFKV